MKMEYGWVCGLRMQIASFIAKPLEVKQPRVITELKLFGSRKVMRKQKALGELKPPQTMGATTEGT